jgi:hypothetical protein
VYEECALPPPTLAVGCNAGVAEYEAWMPTIGHLEASGTPFYFTD